MTASFKPPFQRIASLTCSNTEILAALDLGHLLCAADDHSDFPGEVLKDLPRLGPDLQIDVRRLQDLQPDLVLASLSVPGMEKVVQELETSGLNFVVLDPTSWTGVLESIRTVGQVMRCQERAETLIAAMQQEVEALKASLPVFSHPPRVLIEWWPRPVIVATRDSWITDMLHLLGAENAFVHLEKRSSPVTDQQVLEAQPDLIVCSWCGVRKIRPDVVFKREKWASLAAVQEHRVVVIPESGLGRPGPRLMEGFRALAAALKGLNGSSPFQ
ncbi:ABC transporter substrate-binding protein [Deinococcus roseus]|nr:cobalamin-binding protein [Deinococcus roseus]